MAPCSLHSLFFLLLCLSPLSRGFVLPNGLSTLLRLFAPGSPRKLGLPRVAQHSADAKPSDHQTKRLEEFPPKPPVWSSRFQMDFTEDNYFLFVTLTTKGTYFYDFADNRMRIDRVNGQGDRYCGSAMPGYSTPCTHLVIQGMRYLVFPEEAYCCKCCNSESGCGVVLPDWLSRGNATYMGHDYIFGVLTTKWYIAGLQNNYYWQSVDDVPIRIYQEPITQMTFSPSSFATPTSFNNSLFELPSTLDCSLQCYGVCGLV